MGTEQEFRRQLLLQRAGVALVEPEPSAPAAIEPSSAVPDSRRGSQPALEASTEVLGSGTELVASTSARADRAAPNFVEHINFWKEEEVKAAHPENVAAARVEARKRGNPDTYTTDAKFDERFQLAHGLGKEAPWYARAPAAQEQPQLALSTSGSALLPAGGQLGPPSGTGRLGSGHGAGAGLAQLSNSPAGPSGRSAAAQLDGTGGELGKRASKRHRREAKSRLGSGKSVSRDRSSSDDDDDDDDSTSTSSESASSSDSGSEAHRKHRKHRHGKKSKHKHKSRRRKRERSAERVKQALVLLASHGLASDAHRKVQQLRGERVKREKAERERQRKLLVGGEDTAGAAQNRYNSGFGYANALKAAKN